MTDTRTSSISRSVFPQLKPFAAPDRAKDYIFQTLGYDFTPDDTKRQGLAEMLAMTLFVWVGCGAAVSAQSLTVFDPEQTLDNSWLVVVSLAFGIGIAVLAYTIAVSTLTYTRRLPSLPGNATLYNDVSLSRSATI
jgi:hypothetical protein